MAKAEFFVKQKKRAKARFFYLFSFITKCCFSFPAATSRLEDETLKYIFKLHIYF